jgi:hypothetical protein
MVWARGVAVVHCRNGGLEVVNFDPRTLQIRPTHVGVDIINVS